VVCILCKVENMEPATFTLSRRAGAAPVTWSRPLSCLLLYETRTSSRQISCGLPSPNGSDFDAVDYQMCAVMQEHGCQGLGTSMSWRIDRQVEIGSRSNTLKPCRNVEICCQETMQQSTLVIKRLNSGEIVLMRVSKPTANNSNISVVCWCVAPIFLKWEVRYPYTFFMSHNVESTDLTTSTSGTTQGRIKPSGGPVPRNKWGPLCSRQSSLTVLTHSLSYNPTTPLGLSF
jgi:hypothetical protein